MLRRKFYRHSKRITLTLLGIIAFFWIFNLFTSSDNQASPNNLNSNEQAELGKDSNLDPLELIDWHNYTQIKSENERVGPGEKGSAVIIDSSESEAAKKIFSVNGFNAYASDKISLSRSLPDLRHKNCATKKYQRSLPSVSIIIPFHEEHFSTLMRTVHSSLERAPTHLIKEVILVDDGSKKTFLQKPLEDYIKKNFKNVRLLREAERQGLIRTRLVGARNATGDVLIFLDSHCEASVNYLPPLLQPIAENYRTVSCPFIDVIDNENWSYKPQDEGARGSFDWQLYYKRLPLLPKDLIDPSVPFDSPVMAGGLFAISRKWFWELGGYDANLEIWGGEQYELSFKIWQCGGRMVDTACSRIGHVYRKYSPFPNNVKGDFLGRNYKRVAEVWMDEYKEYVYLRKPNMRTLDVGDLSQQLMLRKNLNCKPFKWFMETVAFDQPARYPLIEPPLFAHGDIRPVSDRSLCIDTKFGTTMQRFGISKCIRGGDGDRNGEQQFDFTFRREIKTSSRSFCFDASESHHHSPVVLYNCHMSGGNQEWRYHPTKYFIQHTSNKMCIDCDIERREIFLTVCDDRESQKWIWETSNSTLLMKLFS